MGEEAPSLSESIAAFACPSLPIAPQSVPRVDAFVTVPLTCADVRRARTEHALRLQRIAPAH